MLFFSSLVLYLLLIYFLFGLAQPNPTLSSFAIVQKLNGKNDKFRVPASKSSSKGSHGGDFVFDQKDQFFSHSKCSRVAAHTNSAFFFLKSVCDPLHRQP